MMFLFRSVSNYTSQLKSASCSLLLPCVVAGAGRVLSDSSDVVQDLSDIGIDTAPSSLEVGVRDALDDVVVEGAISLSRVRRAGSLAGGTPGEDFPVFNSIPRTNFNCQDKGLGYYADVDTGCQVREWPTSRLGGWGGCVNRSKWWRGRRETGEDSSYVVVPGGDSRLM